MTPDQRKLSSVRFWYLFLSSAVCLLLFSDIGEDWTDPGWDAYELDVARPFLTHRSWAATRMFSLLAWTGSWPVLLGLMLLACRLSFPARRRWDKVCLLVGSGCVGLLNTALKAWFSRPRPGGEVYAPLVHETYLSFPSGHAMSSMWVFGFLGYLWGRHRPHRRVAVLSSLACLIAMIGCSRIYLAAHYPGDVLGGFAMGWVCLCAAIGIHHAGAGEPPQTASDSGAR